MFRGNCPTRLDEKGRLKMPADFKHEIDRSYDGRFYITSVEDGVIQLYPLKEWEAIEEDIAKLPVSNQAARMFLNRTSFYGQTATMDAQGRLTISEWLREEFGLKGEVAVLGKLKLIEVRVMEGLSREVKSNPLTPEIMEKLTKDLENSKRQGA
jgi:MraZ protein